VKNSGAYIEHPGKVMEKDERFQYVMAVALNPVFGYREGIVRCITSRSADLQFEGNIDRSELHKVAGESLEHFKIGERLKIKNETGIINELSGKGWDFLGLEDPDIWIDRKTGLMHIYFTIPLKNKIRNRWFIYLGHAVGKNLDSLEMTMPVLTADKNGNGAKELSIAPLNKQGFRYNLVESSDMGEDFWYSTVRVAIAEDMGRPWKYGETVFHPLEHKVPWIAKDASPGPLLPKTFADVGEGKMLGIMNGREASRKVGGKIKHSIFSVGLFVYDYENGKIEWVSPEPFLRDSRAKIITFASQFVETGEGRGILYAHVDDSFVRAYTLSAGAMKSLLP
jgi:hypothetical protein